MRTLTQISKLTLELNNITRPGRGPPQIGHFRRRGGGYSLKDTLRKKNRRSLKLALFFPTPCSSTVESLS